MPVERFPRLASYLESLPAGLASYPDCQARASLCVSLIEGMPSLPPTPDQVPEPMATYLARMPKGLWLPEVHVMAVSLTIADHFGMDDAAYLAWLEEVNRKYFSSLVLRVLMGFVSPAELAPRAPARWAAIHRGSTLTSEVIRPGEGRIELEFPPGLFAPILLQQFTAVFQAAFRHSRAKQAEVALVEASSTRGVYEARWS